MVRFLVIGDFNAVLKKSLMKKAEKQEFDAVLGLGDFGGDKRIGRTIFKYWGRDWQEILGKKKTREILKSDFDKATRIMRWLNSLKTPVFLVFGNNDQYLKNWQFVKDKKGELKKRRLYGDLVDKVKKFKNLKHIHGKVVRFKGISIYGHGGFVTSNIYLSKKVSKSVGRYKARKKEYDKDKKLLLKRKHMDIFIVHYPLYGVFDKIDNSIVKKMHGKKIGFKPYNLAVKKFKPEVVFCSHMEEHSSKKVKYYSSLVVNPGSALLGRFALLDFDEKNKKVRRIKFFR